MYTINKIDILLPATCGPIVPIDIKIYNNSLVTKEIEKKIYLANPIVPKNGQNHIKILSTLHKSIATQHLHINTAANE